ncbi:MAG: helix-turn-helix domain-containing protein [Armatimonadota bacterium]|nr:helix-turn-helix domain-containing protein [Armatimonadota bacterium]
MNLADAIRRASQERFGTLPHEAPSEVTVASDESEAMPIVRFEVRLTTQQLHDLLLWMARHLHPVMTLREAAHYLRLRTTELLVLAENGTIPAFKVDGKWRFLKRALDEWMLSQRATELKVKEEEPDVA